MQQGDVYLKFPESFLRQRLGAVSLAAPLRALYPCNNSLPLNSRTCSELQTAKIGLNTAWPQARFSSSAGYPNRAQVATQVTLSGDEGAAKIFRLAASNVSHGCLGNRLARADPDYFTMYLSISSAPWKTPKISMVPFSFLLRYAMR